MSIRSKQDGKEPPFACVFKQLTVEQLSVVKANLQLRSIIP